MDFSEFEINDKPVEHVSSVSAPVHIKESIQPDLKKEPVVYFFI